MNLKFISVNFTYKLCLLTTKISGFWYLTTIRIDEHLIECKRKWSDYVIFAMSLLFSLHVLFDEESSSIKIRLRSTALNLGTIILWQSSAISILTSKVINFFGGWKSLGILRSFISMDRQVNFYYRAFKILNHFLNFR